MIIRYVQHQHFSHEIRALTNEKVGCNKLKKVSSLYRLDPFIEDRILRVGGWLDRVYIPYDAKHPILMPKDSSVSKLFISEVHKSVGQFGKISMLLVLREHYWIIYANATIKNLVSKCVVCR